jgi:hypothetical protein
LTRRGKNGCNSSRTTRSFTVVSDGTFDVATVYQDGAQDYVIDQKYIHLKTEDKTKPFLGAPCMLPKPGSFPTAKIRAELAH